MGISLHTQTPLPKSPTSQGRPSFLSLALPLPLSKPNGPPALKHRCDTVEPVTAYNSRKLVLEDKIVFDETKMRSEDEEEDGGQWFPPGGAADQDFTNDLKRGEICVFVEGGARHIHQAEVAVRSVVEFMPGVRVAVATEPDSVAAYEM